MKNISTKEKRELNIVLKAVLSLKMELADLRYGIIKHEETDADANCRDQIIAIIKEQHNKDFYQVMASENVEAMLEYENLLSNYLNELLRQYTNPESIDDNLKILDISHDISTLDIFKGKSIEIGGNVESAFRKIKESRNHIKGYINEPDYLSIIDPDFLSKGITPMSDFILTKKVQDRNGTESIFFAMLSIDRKHIVERIDVDLALLLNYKMNEVRFNSPIKMFLYLLNRYGIELEIDGIQKKIFFKEDIAKEKISNIINTFINNLKQKKRQHNVYFRWSGKEREEEKVLDFAFGFDYEKYVKEYNNGVI